MSDIEGDEPLDSLDDWLGGDFKWKPWPTFVDSRSKHPVSVTFREHTCFCGKAAGHKIGEEGTDPRMHNLTAWVCCKHFSKIISWCGGWEPKK